MYGWHHVSRPKCDRVRRQRQRVRGRLDPIRRFSTREPASLHSTYKRWTPKLFVLKLGLDGALLYSTFFGGRSGDNITALAADSAGNIYLAGQTPSQDDLTDILYQSDREYNARLEGVARLVHW